jgi:hypothetical protein
MTSARRAKQRARARKGAQRRRPTLAIGLGIVGVVGLVAFIAASVLGGSPGSDRVEATFVKTGTVNEMGMPVIETPGGASGIARAGGAEVEGATWQMGIVPLLVAVRPSWTIVNTSSRPLLLGEPHPEVREGCCPGPFTLGTHRLAPGASTELTFELSMHPGMDGWHDIFVHVPVRSPSDDRVLSLRVTGDFRGSLS